MKQDARERMRQARYVFEHKSQPLLPRAKFHARVLRFASICAVGIQGTLALGTLGYHTLEDQDWLEAALNAAMILTGMGPVDELHTSAGKVFAIVYALFSGTVFLSLVALFLAPIAHRLLHAFHIENEESR